MSTIRSCPICACNVRTVLHTQKFANHFEHKVGMCAACGFVYVYNLPPQKFYDDYYKNQSKYNGVRRHEFHDVPTEQAIRFILKKFIPNKEANILDVGCSTGVLLHSIKKEGYNNLTGIEPSPECKLVGKDKFGVSIVSTTFEKFEKKQKYDLIIFSQLFEHLIDVRSVIIKVQSLLKENGMVFVGVPNADSFGKNIEEPFGEISTEHINFFTYRSLLHLFSRFENVYKKNDSYSLLTLWKVDKESEDKFYTYISKSKFKMTYILKVIKSLPDNSIIWGVGALTQRLLKTTNLKKKVFKFIDGNTNLIGKKIEVIDIIAPDDLVCFDNPILISSYRFQKEIMAEIKLRKLKNRIMYFK